jgi:hypothetical protein
MSRHHHRRACLLVLAGALFSVATIRQAAAQQSVDPRAAFERLKSLAGTWEGQAGDDRTRPPATVVYRVASGGSVLQETLFPGTPHEMISMYHLADGNLVLTHYCALANQPRMKLDTKASSADRLVFAFDGGTNFDPAKDPHIHSGVIEMKGDALRNEWASWRGGKEAGREAFVLRRKN